MALVGILSLLFAPTRASEELLWRWNLLFRSQEGYAILLQNQDEYKCCGFADDFDNAAQPCMMNESGERSHGCGSKLVEAFEGMAQRLSGGQFAVLLILLAGVYFVRKEVARVDEEIRGKYGKSWSRYEKSESGGSLV